MKAQLQSDWLSECNQTTRQDRVEVVTQILDVCWRNNESTADTANRIVTVLVDLNGTEDTKPAPPFYAAPYDPAPLFAFVRENLAILREYGVNQAVINHRAESLVDALNAAYMIEERPQEE